MYACVQNLKMVSFAMDSNHGVAFIDQGEFEAGTSCPRHSELVIEASTHVANDKNHCLQQP